MSDPNQLVLLSEPRHRHDDPATSKAAAETVKPSHQARLLRIAALVDDAGRWGMTADEVWLRIQQEDGLPSSKRATWHGAVSAAFKAGLIDVRDDGAGRLSTNNSFMRIYVTRWHQT